MSATKGCLAGKNVLVVENEWLIAADLMRALMDQGAHVVGPVASVGQALALLDRTSGIDVAVLDIHLGNGSDVYPVAEALRRLDIPFIFATGYDDVSVRHDFSNIPHLTKPFMLSDVSSLLVIAADGFSVSVSPPATKQLAPKSWQDSQ